MHFYHLLFVFLLIHDDFDGVTHAILDRSNNTEKVNSTLCLFYLVLADNLCFL